MKNKAVYPGTFDPLTNGHLDIIKRAAKMFDEVTVAVAEASHKKPLFSWKDRIDMVKNAVKGKKGIRVASYKGMLVDFLAKEEKRIVIRGLRAFSDFEYEFMLALTNKKLGKDIEMIYMMPEEQYMHISSSAVKEIAIHKGNIAKFVNSDVNKRLKQKFR